MHPADCLFAQKKYGCYEIINDYKDGKIEVDFVGLTDEEISYYVESIMLSLTEKPIFISGKKILSNKKLIESLITFVFDGIKLKNLSFFDTYEGLSYREFPLGMKNGFITKEFNCYYIKSQTPKDVWDWMEKWAEI